MRVVAVTVDASLAAAFSMVDDWEVVQVRDPDEAAGSAVGASVVVIGMGATEDGLALVEDLFAKGVTIPFVVVGDLPAPESARAPVVIRPFSLDDLRDAVSLATGSGAAMRSAPAAPRSAPVEPARPEPSVAPIPAQEPVARAEDAPATQSSAPPRPSVEVRAQPAPEPPRPVPPLHREPEDPAQGGSTPATLPPIPPEAVVRSQPEDERPPAAQRSAPPWPAAPIPQPPPEQSQERRRFLRKRPLPAPVEEPASSTLASRIRSAIAGAEATRQLLEELPMLADISSMAQALLDEALLTFGPQTAAVFVRSPEGFVVHASHGLSGVERSMVVPEDQPLIADLILSLEAMLIAPVDLARGLVTGIPGTRAESMIAAPVEVSGMVTAIIVLGRDTFSDEDLERLDDLAREGAPGLTLARLLDDLRRRGRA